MKISKADKEKKKVSLAVKKNLNLLRKLEYKFMQSGIELEKTNNIHADLADIYTECKEFVQLIDNFVRCSGVTDKEAIAQMLTKIQILLFHHVYWHMKELAKTLDYTIDNLYGGKKRKYTKQLFKFK